MIEPAVTLKIERMRYNAYTLEQRLVGKLLVAERFDEVKLYVLISSRLCRGSVREVARAAVTGGADAIQLREKDTPDAQILAFAAEMRELTDETGKIFIVNDRPDIAALVGADGVHLGQSDLPVAEARRLLRPGAIVGRSTHNIQQAKAAVTEGADYVSVGPMFETTTKDAGPVVAPDVLKQICEQIDLPAVAVGGINSENIGEVVAAGAKHVAVCSAVCGADDPKAAAEEIQKRLS